MIEDAQGLSGVRLGFSWPASKPKPKTKPTIYTRSITGSNYTWLLDPGHGSLQPGKRSPEWSDGSQLLEWQFTRRIVRLMSVRLARLHIDHVIIVQENKVGSFLPTRVQRANSWQKRKKNCILVSIHGNAAGSPQATGIETWYYPGSNGKYIASAFQGELIRALEWKDRGTKCSIIGRRAFYILRKSKMPAILTENGFYSNEGECRLMMQQNTCMAIADAHVAAIMRIEQDGISGLDSYPIDSAIAY